MPDPFIIFSKSHKPHEEENEDELEDEEINEDQASESDYE